MKKYLHAEVNSSEELWKEFDKQYLKSGIKSKSDFLRVIVKKGLGLIK